jgi:hypothetical protein
VSIKIKPLWTVAPDCIFPGFATAKEALARATEALTRAKKALAKAKEELTHIATPTPYLSANQFLDDAHFHFGHYEFFTDER